MRRNWTGAEVEHLRQIIFSGGTLVEAAKTLGRSYSAIRNKAELLREKGAPLPDSRLTKLRRVDFAKVPLAVRKVFKHAKDEGFTIERIAKRAGVAHNTVKNMLHHGNPTWGNFVAVANAVGYRVALIDDDGREAA